MPSAARTVAAPVADPGRLANPRALLPLAWPNRAPDDQLDYTLDCTAWLADAADTLAAVTATIVPQDAPTALSPVYLAAVGGLITVWLASGTPGETYTVKLAGTTNGGRAFAFQVSISVIDPIGAWPMPPTIPTLITGGVTGNLTATGTTQATALPLPSQVNIVTGAASGAGVILKALIGSSVSVVNESVNDLLVYPSVGAEIGAYGVNTPVTVSPGASATFDCASAAQFYAR